MCAQSVTTHVADNTVAPALDALILMDARGKTVTLPDARGHAGLPCVVKNTQRGAKTTIAGHEGQPIEGTAPGRYTLEPPLAFARLECDGAGWWVVAAG